MQRRIHRFHGRHGGQLYFDSGPITSCLGAFAFLTKRLESLTQVRETFPPFVNTARNGGARHGLCQAPYSRDSYVDNLLSQHIAPKPERCTVGRAFGLVGPAASQWRPSRGCKHLEPRIRLYSRRNFFCHVFMEPLKCQCLPRKDRGEAL